MFGHATKALRSCMIALLICFSALLNAAPLPASQVFSLHAQQTDPNTLQLHWTIQPGFFLYKERIHIKRRFSDDVQIGTFQLPKARIKKDKQGNTHLIYRQSLTLDIPLLGREAGESVLNVHYQGCSDAGYCYPPQLQAFVVQMGTDHTLKAIMPMTPPASIETSEGTTGQLSALFKEKSIWLVLLSFFGFGILLAFTPCVLPMIPVLSSMLLQNKAFLSPKKAFCLSFSYVLGLSLTYALLGAGFAYMGGNLQLLFQTPLAIGGLSLLFIILALSMFDVFELRLPSSLQARFSSIFQHQIGRSYGSAFVMGCLSVLILSPCVTPPLVGVFLYVAETGNVGLGMMALFCLGLGSGMPLLILSVSASHYLPKAGPWMQWIKALFGMLLLLVALHLLSGLFSFSSNQSVTKVNTVQALDEVIKQNTGHPLVLDYDASWCTACRVMEKTTLQDPAVLALLKQVHLIKVDVTHRHSQALLHAYKVMGPPTFIFIKADGKEMPELRTVGEVSAEEMVAHLQTLVRAP
ncbi:MAG: protein-disulfide reductase DsbD [Gammaproteobacteria bacterium]|nr:protein-disulfide reductase DsbD [Gammaproteobacteria bacterium]